VRIINTNQNVKTETDWVVENYYGPAVSSQRNREPKAQTPTQRKTQDDTQQSIHTCTGTRDDTTVFLFGSQQSCDDGTKKWLRLQLAVAVKW
jgi:hypothetical protein